MMSVGGSDADVGQDVLRREGSRRAEDEPGEGEGRGGRLPVQDQRPGRRHLGRRPRVDAADLRAGRARDAPVHDRIERRGLPRHGRRRHAGGDVAVLQRQAEGGRRSDAGDQADQAAAGGRVAATSTTTTTGPDEVRRVTLVWGAVVTLLALGVRLAWVLAVQTVPVSDFAMYRESANYLSEFGHLDPGFIYMPGFVVLLAWVKDAGGGLLAQKLLGVAFGTLGTGALFAVATQLLD